MKLFLTILVLLSSTAKAETASEVESFNFLKSRFVRGISDLDRALRARSGRELLIAYDESAGSTKIVAGITTTTVAIIAPHLLLTTRGVFDGYLLIHDGLSKYHTYYDYRAETKMERFRRRLVNRSAISVGLIGLGIAVDGLISKDNSKILHLFIDLIDQIDSSLVIKTTATGTLTDYYASEAGLGEFLSMTSEQASYFLANKKLGSTIVTLAQNIQNAEEQLNVLMSAPLP